MSAPQPTAQRPRPRPQTAADLARRRAAWNALWDRLVYGAMANATLTTKPHESR